MSKNKKSKDSPRKRKIEIKDPYLNIPINDVLDLIGVKDWDVVIVGDGSGTSWNSPCGWAAVVYENQTNTKEVVCGGMSHGTSYVAEIMPYINSLIWYTANSGRTLLHKKITEKPLSFVNIHIITDSIIVANQGNRKCERKMNKDLWALIDSISSRGYSISWHWVARERLEFNKIADKLSRENRLTLKDCIEDNIKNISSLLDGKKNDLNSERHSE